MDKVKSNNGGGGGGGGLQYDYIKLLMFSFKLFSRVINFSISSGYIEKESNAIKALALILA